MQTKFAAGAFAGNGRPGWIGGRQARTLGIAGGRPPFSMGQVRGQPVLALGQGLGMGVNHFEAVKRRAEPQQVVADQKAGFTDDVQRRVQQQIKRTGDHAFAGVFDRHHPKLGAAGRGGPEHFIDADAWHPLDAGAEELQRRLFAESAGRAQIGDPLGCLQGAASRHDLAPDDGHTAAFERTGIACLQAADDLGLALRSEHRRAVHLLDLADLMSERGPLVEQREQF